MKPLKLVYSKNENICALNNICFKCGSFNSIDNKIYDYFEPSLSGDDILLCESCIDSKFEETYTK